MVIDSSAIMASLSAEPDADRFRRAPTAASECRISVSNVFECRVVLGGRFSAAMLREFRLLIAKLPIVIDPFDADAAVLAHRAYWRFGKAPGHPARLNLGDCAAYALARSRGLPLLFKGADFAATDVQPTLS